MKFKNLLKFMLVFGAVSLSTNNAFADISGYQVGVGYDVFAGLNVNVGKRFKSDNFFGNMFALRLDMSTSSVIGGFELTAEDENRFKVKFEAFKVGALLDFYPFGDIWFLGNLRVSGGYYLGNYKIQEFIEGNMNESFFFDNKNYVVSGNGKLTTEYKNKMNGPYLGIGFDFALIAGLKLYLDAGLVFTENGSFSSGLSGDLTVNGQPVANNPDINGLLGALNNEIDQTVGKLKNFFPVVKAGLLYRF